MLDHVLNMYYTTVDDLFQSDAKLNDMDITKRTRILSGLCQVNDVIKQLAASASSIESLADMEKTNDIVEQFIALTKRLQGIDNDLMSVESLQVSSDGQRYQKKRMIGETVNILNYWEQLLVTLEQFLENNQNYIPNFQYLFTDNSLRQITIDEIADRLQIENTRYYKAPDMKSIEKLVLELELTVEELENIIMKVKTSFELFINKNHIDLIKYL